MVFAIHQHELDMCPPHPEPLPPPSSPDLSGLSQSTGFGYPALCIKLALIILFYIW